MATLIPSFKKDNPFESINDNELIGLTLMTKMDPRIIFYGHHPKL